MLLNSLREAELVQLLTCQPFEPTYFHQEVERQAPIFEQGIPHLPLFSSLGFRSS